MVKFYGESKKNYNGDFMALTIIKAVLPILVQLFKFVFDLILNYKKYTDEEKKMKIEHLNTFSDLVKKLNTQNKNEVLKNEKDYLKLLELSKQQRYLSYKKFILQALNENKSYLEISKIKNMGISTRFVEEAKYGNNLVKIINDIIKSNEEKSIEICKILIEIN